MDQQPFNAGAALAFLDDVAARFGASALPSLEPAWDAAWIVCLTLDRRHETAARAALAGVLAEMARLPATPPPAGRTEATSGSPPPIVVRIVPTR